MNIDGFRQTELEELIQKSVVVAIYNERQVKNVCERMCLVSRIKNQKRMTAKQRRSRKTNRRGKKMAAEASAEINFALPCCEVRDVVVMIGIVAS
jgi:hypothetical protein